MECIDMKIYVMVNHELTSDQLIGLNGYELVYPTEVIKKGLVNSPDDEQGLQSLVYEIVNYLNDQNINTVLCPAGSPIFMAMFAIVCNRYIINLMFSHSIRISNEVTNPNGSVTKSNVFKHIKYITL